MQVVEMTVPYQIMKFELETIFFIIPVRIKEF
jgi:hypothetical protein